MGVNYLHNHIETQCMKLVNVSTDVSVPERNTEVWSFLL